MPLQFADGPKLFLVDKKKSKGIRMSERHCEHSHTGEQVRALSFLFTQHSFPLTKVIDKPQPNFNRRINKIHLHTKQNSLDT